ncbi:MAG: hypothetical protein PHS37_01435 [Candidatus Omnitrophica bacterium]|nr:hypothetical protein [Candidatus Omnitrophota bacterium]
MTEKLESAQDVFLGKINRICNKFGLNNVMAQLYAVLYLSNKPLSLTDMVERLKISKGSVSVNIRALERYNAVRRVWIKGSRRDYYEAEQDIYKVIFDRIKSMAGSRLSEFEDMINSSCRAVDTVVPADSEDEESIKVFKRRLDTLKNLHHKAQSLFELFDASALTMLKKE